MANSTFYNQIAKIGAQLSTQLAPQLGVQLQYSHRGGAPITLNGFLPKETKVTKELIMHILAGVERMTFYVAQTVGFPPSEGIVILDQIIWTPTITNTPITMAIETINDCGNLQSMYLLTCYSAVGRQVGQVGMAR